MKQERRPSYRTDLACERHRADLDLPGTMYREETEGFFTLSRLEILDEESEEVIGRPRGHYLTVCFPQIRLLGEEDRGKLSALLARELAVMCRTLTGREPAPSLRVLIAGLGNSGMTSDAVGPDTVRRISATGHLRHLEPKLFRSLGCAEVYTVTPGVLSQTGMEAADTLRGLCDELHPGLVIVIDALAARSVRRLATTVQASDTGISPGSGIGNRRGAINRDTLGVPVLSIGVPTVVEAMTLVADTLEEAGHSEAASEELFRRKRDLFYVTPKDIDETVSHYATVLSGAMVKLLSLPV